MAQSASGTDLFPGRSIPDPHKGLAMTPPPIIDALQCGTFDREVFQMLQAGGYRCVTPTLGFWEGTLESLDSLARWRDMERENADLIRIVRRADDIRACFADGKVGILLGYQNTNLLEDRIRYVELFADLGVRVLQLTYNNQNELGGSCYEKEDSGLTRFGREVVGEMAIIFPVFGRKRSASMPIVPAFFSTIWPCWRATVMRCAPVRPFRSSTGRSSPRSTACRKGLWHESVFSRLRRH